MDVYRFTGRKPVAIDLSICRTGLGRLWVVYWIDCFCFDKNDKSSPSLRFMTGYTMDDFLNENPHFFGMIYFPGFTQPAIGIPLLGMMFKHL